MSWDEAYKSIDNLDKSITPDFWMKVFESNPDALYTLLADIYYISEYRKTGVRRKKDGIGSLADLWKLLE